MYCLSHCLGEAGGGGQGGCGCSSRLGWEQGRGTSDIARVVWGSGTVLFFCAIAAMVLTALSVMASTTVSRAVILRMTPSSCASDTVRTKVNSFLKVQRCFVLGETSVHLMVAAANAANRRLRATGLMVPKAVASEAPQGLGSVGT